MTTKRFHVPGPDELRELKAFAKEPTGAMVRTAYVWAAARRKRGETRWDKAIYVCFSAGRTRDAGLFRFTSDGRIEHIATLKYNKALGWCEEHLRWVND